MDTQATSVLRIESDEIVRLAEELASLLGVSVADAVTTALRDEIGREREAELRFRRMEEIAAAIRTEASYPMVRSDHSWLYDENGLPT